MSQEFTLDPSKVKVGDTVTLEKASAKHIDIVERVAHLTTVEDGDRSPFWEVVTRSLGLVYTVGPDHWTLTAHQPAPEPEPEWEPGTVANITVDFDTHRAIRAKNGVWRSDGNESFTDFRVDEVRPLVVIDPATVDWRGLQAQMSVHVVGAEPFRRAGEILDVVRRELGIAEVSA